MIGCLKTIDIINNHIISMTNIQLYTIKKSDGFGAQYWAMMSGIAICEYKGYTYFHTPFKSIEHDVNVEQLNEFIGIKQEDSYDESLKQSIIVEMYSSEVLNAENPNLYFSDNVLNKIRTMYYSSYKPDIPNIDIAIHIRRGDVSENDPSTKSRYTDNKTYVAIINQLKKLYPTYKITIFSEGTVDDFKELNLDESNFILNGDIRFTFHCMVCAKVLITAMSAFSNAAGLLNVNTRYHHPNYPQKRLDGWLDLRSLY